MKRQTLTDSRNPGPIVFICKIKRKPDTLIFTWNGGQLTADKNKFTE